jgi:hypothetical protein
LDEVLREKLVSHRENRLIDDDGRTVRLTRQGKCVADGIAAEWL